MSTNHLIGAVTGLLLVLMSASEAQAGLWCPTPIPGVLMKYCLCEAITGTTEVSSPTPLSPLTLFGLWRDLNATAMVDWGGARPSPRGKVGRWPVIGTETVRLPGRSRAALSFTTMLVTRRRDQRHAFRRAIAEGWSAFQRPIQSL